MPASGRAIDRTSTGAPTGGPAAAALESPAAGSSRAALAVDRAPPYEGGSPHSTAAITRNVAPLIRTANVPPPAATSRPPSAGPTTNPTLSRLAQALFAGPS